MVIVPEADGTEITAVAVAMAKEIAVAALDGGGIFIGPLTRTRITEISRGGRLGIDKNLRRGLKVGESHGF